MEVTMEVTMVATAMACHTEEVSGKNISNFDINLLTV